MSTSVQVPTADHLPYRLCIFQGHCYRTIHYNCSMANGEGSGKSGQLTSSKNCIRCSSVKDTTNGPCMLDWIQGGLWSPLWAPRSWTRAPPVPPASCAEGPMWIPMDPPHLDPVKHTWARTDEMFAIVFYSMTCAGEAIDFAKRALKRTNAWP